MCRRVFSAIPALALALALTLGACATPLRAPAPASVLPQAASVDAASDPDAWTWRVSPYLWAADLSGDTTVGGNAVSFDQPFKDTVEQLDLGGQLLVEARQGRWTFLADGTYLAISSDGAIKPGPGPLPPQPVEVETSLVIAGVGAVYQVSPDTPLELGAGLRHLAFDTKVEVGALPALRDEVDFTDAVFIARHTVALDDAALWELGLYGDIGAGDSDLTWQGVVTASRRLDGWTLSVGYRHLAYDLGGDGDTRLSFSGALFGASLGF